MEHSISITWHSKTEVRELDPEFKDEIRGAFRDVILLFVDEKAVAIQATLTSKVAKEA